MQNFAPDRSNNSSRTAHHGPRSQLLALFVHDSPHPFPTAIHERPNADILDADQKISEELAHLESPEDAVAFSQPPPLDFFGSPAVSPLPMDDLPEVDLSSSPAAMFLSAFSPTVSERSLPPDDEGAVVAGYTLGPIVGRGGFSIIRTAFSLQGGTVAVKIVRHADLDKQPDPALARKSLKREALVWASLNHEHVLPLFTVNHTSYADFFFTVYCPAGSLFDILKRDGNPALPQDDAGMMFRQVVRGLRYMHEVAGFVHGDLKLENVLVDEMGVCKIGDFGMARKIGEIDDPLESEGEGVQRSRTLSQARPPSSRSAGRAAVGKLPQHLSLRLRHGIPTRHRTSSPYPASGSPTVPNRGYEPGSLPYAAPELLLSPETTSTPYAAHPAQDIWALGVMLFTLLTGKLPFSDSFEPRLQMKILHGAFDMPQGVGRCAEQALRGCIERSVPARWTVAMVDEVAWGIGWGSAADDVTPPSDPEKVVGSRSPSRCPVKTRKESASAMEDWSALRSARSTSRSTSAVRTASRSKSRPPHENRYHHHPLLNSSPAHASHPAPTQPSLSVLTNAILRSTSGSSSDGCSSVQDSAIVIRPDPVPSCERGRAPRPRVNVDLSTSRSRSPNDMPVTPRDPSLDALRRRKASPARPSLSSPDLPELDTVDEDARWALTPDRESARSLSRYAGSSGSGSGSASRSRGRAFSRSRDELQKALRNESMPPVLSPSWMRPPAAAAARESGSFCGSGGAAPSTPMAIPGAAQSPRSRSLGPGSGTGMYRARGRAN